MTTTNPERERAGVDATGVFSEASAAPRRSIGTIVADILAVRRPTRLVVDGFVSWLLWLALSGVHNAYAWENYGKGSPSDLPFMRRLFRLDSVFELSESALYYAGVVLIAVGCARIVAESLWQRSGARE